MNIRNIAIVFAAMATGGAAGWALRTCTSTPAVSGGTALTNGPWGDLTAWTIRLEPPQEFFGTDINFSYQGKWHFPESSPQEVRALLVDAGLSGENAQKLLATARPIPGRKGIELIPDKALLTTMSPGTRAHLYFKLAEWPENEAQTNPRVYTEESFRDSFDDSPHMTDVVRRMLYSDGKLLYFADAKTVFDEISSQAEQLRFLRSISYVRAQLVKLHVSHGADARAIAEYWDNDAKAKDHEVLLESIARRPEGGEIDIVHLLPRFARKLLYTYPLPSSLPASKWKNCHWTSLNFFSGDVPDDEYLDPQKVASTLKHDYAAVEGAPKLGDLVLFEKGGQVIHTANYIAADILFTKNGNSALRPWVLMHQSDVLTFYSLPGPPLTTRYFRKK